MAALVRGEFYDYDWIIINKTKHTYFFHIMKIGTPFFYKLRILLVYKDLLRNHCGHVSRHFIKKFRQSQLKAAHSLQNRQCLNVAFLLTIPSMWKLDPLFKLMQKDSRFHPYVVLFPYSAYKGYNKDELEKMLETSKHFIEQKGYEYLVPYDDKRNVWTDIKKTHHPDIVFFTTPYKDVLPQYYIYHFRDTLTCYLPYAFTPMDFYKKNYDLIFHNLVGLFFQETEIHKDLAKKYGRNKGENAFVTGYPATELYLDKSYIPDNPWKPQDRLKKKLIFAPHHSVETDHNSTFFKYCDSILSLAVKYKECLQIAFKPHPSLKIKLQKIWGVERTEAYYDKWASMSNTQLVTEGYEDLFLTSDALIHDCGSFTTEYLFTKKPVMYLCRDDDMAMKFNVFGVKAFEHHYHAYSIEDVEKFIQNVVVNGVDPMKVQRERFFEEQLKPKDGILPSQKILNTIEQFINEYIS